MISRRGPRRWFFASIATLGASLASCSDAESVSPVVPVAPSAPSDACDPVDLDSPRVFTPCERGGGVFGRWFVDEGGLPAYEYTLDQTNDDRALYPNTEKRERREHWHAFGNRRINAMFFNDGYIEVTHQDRGVEYLNQFDASRGSYAGGFSFITEGGAQWATAYAYRPNDAETRRVFGMGYAEASTHHRGITVSRRSFGAAGRDPLLIDEVTITNTSAETRSLAHHEYFDVARFPVEINWAVSGDPLDSSPIRARLTRHERNAMFAERVDYDADAQLLVLRRSHEPTGAGRPDPEAPIPPRDLPSPTDFYPADPFLVALDAEVTDTFTEGASFFGGGGPTAPDALRGDVAGEGVATGPRGAVWSGAEQPRIFVMKTPVTLAPGEQRKLRFGFGFTAFGEPIVIDPKYRDPSTPLFEEAREALRAKLPAFATNEAPELTREMAWHASQIEVSVGEREYFEGPLVPQGSAYLYLHGADGAARDLGLFALPLVYTDPTLARAELELNMRITHSADRRKSYAFQGHGMLDDAGGLHRSPSDLDLFFLWALGEYLGATGDLAFLDTHVPFHPKHLDPEATVLTHVRASIRHLFDEVGVGPHGLIHVGTGDWSDGILGDTGDRDRAIADGESVPNTQMAIAVLPRIADLLQDIDEPLSREIDAAVDGYREALGSAWGEGFYGRAYFGDDVLLRRDEVDLEAQVWALIGDSFATDDDRASTIDAIHRELDAPSRFGAALRKGGQVWPAISALLTDGYSRSRPDLAWEHFRRNTMASRATAFPENWVGIWSGPDGLSSVGDGDAWFSVVTPMTDFPTMNNNQHAMPLYAMVRMAGIRAEAHGLRVDPKIPGEFSLVTSLVSVRKKPDSLYVAYTPIGDAQRAVELVAPPGQRIMSATQDGAAVAVKEDAVSRRFIVRGDGVRTSELEIATGP